MGVLRCCGSIVIWNDQQQSGQGLSKRTRFRNLSQNDTLLSNKVAAGVSQPFVRSMIIEMNCKISQSDLSLYADGYLDAGEAARVQAHLAECPVCRDLHFELREIKNGLRRLSRPAVPAEVVISLKRAVADEVRLGRSAKYSFSQDVRQWMRMTLMPYGVGVFASLTVALLFLFVLFSNTAMPGRYSAFNRGDANTDQANTLAGITDPLDISPAGYASTRLDVAGESPSVNPKGALIALTKSMVRGGMKDDEVVVVADVFGNGLARISEVVEPSRDRNAVVELERALESDPNYAPFVPAVMDQRSNNVRVVLRFQSVDVKTGLKKRKR